MLVADHRYFTLRRVFRTLPEQKPINRLAVISEHRTIQSVNHKVLASGPPCGHTPFAFQYLIARFKDRTYSAEKPTVLRGNLPRQRIIFAVA